MSHAASNNAAVVAELGSCPLWSHFSELSNIPRPSKKEAAVLTYLKSFADARKLKWSQDVVGNLVISRPGSGGGEDAEPVLLQGHVDMVCEKNSDSSHDFDRDPLRLRRDGAWLRATDTTLGADNGIGVAAALAVLESGPEALLPPVEALFTVDEETGLTGATNLDGSLITATRLLNLDTEELGNVYIGCAGGANSTLKLNAKQVPLEGTMTRLHIKIFGLMGGHSGINIHEGRGNAVQMAAQLAADALATSPGGRLVRISGGDKHNAIPREAEVLLALAPEAVAGAKEAASKASLALKAEYGLLETELAASIVEETSSEKLLGFSKEDSSRILTLLRIVPHGVVKMSHAIQGLVETSNNLASVRTTQDGIEAVLSTRSSIGSALEATRDKIQLMADLAGASLDRQPAYPGWAPAPSTPLVELAVQKLRARCGNEPQVMAIHAGLECGLLLERCPTVKQAVSFGPTITGAHSPDEALEISTVEPFYSALMDMLQELAVKKS